MQAFTTPSAFVCTPPSPDTLVPGAVLYIAQHRASYSHDIEARTHRLDQASPDELLALLSAASSANTASTSQLLGSVKMLVAMARAVRNRSYVLMAADISDSLALPLRMADSLVSKASVKSFTAMGFVFLEVDLSGDRSQEVGAA